MALPPDGFDIKDLVREWPSRILFEGNPTAPEHARRWLAMDVGHKPATATYMGIPINTSASIPPGVLVLQPTASVPDDFPDPVVEVRWNGITQTAVVPLGPPAALPPEEEAAIMARLREALDVLAKRVLGGI